MPELPEVETIKRQLSEVLVGKLIGEVGVLKEKSFIGDRLSVVGYRIIGVRRFGKALVIDLQKPKAKSPASPAGGEERKATTKNLKFITNNLSLVIHLKMTGQLIYEDHEL